MRKIHGWIINLTDALGPDPGTVEVAALLNDTDKIELEEHTLGYLDRTHQTGGSGSEDHADSDGHFGWDMEFSPGPITTRIVASDPQPTQHRARFPDESAQIGKAFHSDLERLGWAAGRDCLVWGAIEGAAQPDAASWSSDPVVSSRQGDWSVADFGTGADAGRVLLNRGIGFLGGVVISIETPNYPLLVPVLGEDAAEANSGTTDRWDLLYAYMDITPSSPTYGKQGIRIQSGGSVIPALNQVAGERRMVLHALKMAAGGGAYTEAYDLRPWQEPPSRTIPGLASATTRYYTSITNTVIGTTRAASAVNTAATSDEVLLSLDTAWMGMATLTGNVAQHSAGSELFAQANTEGRSTVGGDVVTGTDYLANPTPEGFARVLPMTGSASPGYWGQFAIPFPVRRIPSGAEGRTWHRLRFAAYYWTRSGGLYVAYPNLAVHLWPVP